jgi:hypothetical protein
MGWLRRACCIMVEGVARSLRACACAPPLAAAKTPATVTQTSRLRDVVHLTISTNRRSNELDL